MDAVPYEGATERVLTKKEKKDGKKAAKALAKEEKKKKNLHRGGIHCTCGKLATNYTALPRYHDDSCIINKKLKRRKK